VGRYIDRVDHEVKGVVEVEGNAQREVKQWRRGQLEHWFVLQAETCQWEAK
jgi:hypothetical protein